MDLPSSRSCFVCGKENPIGLKVRFERTPEGVQAKVRPAVHFEGFDGVLQGGIVTGLMDDAMWFAIFASSGTVTMTAELVVRFKAPVPVDTPLVVTAKMIEQRRALASCAASIAAEDGRVLAEATGRFLPAPKPIASRLLESLS
jgi:acyl-coenzyme A thioesterase PaaI-like protein